MLGGRNKSLENFRVGDFAARAADAVVLTWQRYAKTLYVSGCHSAVVASLWLPSFVNRGGDRPTLRGDLDKRNQAIILSGGHRCRSVAFNVSRRPSLIVDILKRDLKVRVGDGLDFRAGIRPSRDCSCREVAKEGRNIGAHWNTAEDQQSGNREASHPGTLQLIRYVGVKGAAVYG